MGFGLPRPSPGKQEKNSQKIGKLAQKQGFGAIFLFFGYFSYFPGGGPWEPETYIFPIFFLFRAGGPKPILYQANGIATQEGYGGGKDSKERRRATAESRVF